MHKTRHQILEHLYLYAHKKYFARRLSKQVHFKSKYVISVGNLSAGGTGKTPVSALLLRHLKQKKHQPLLVLRGYKGELARCGALIFDGQKLFHQAKQAGDEALLLSGVPDTRVAVGKDRARAVQLYGANHSVVILDDAFQNPLVYHDHDLVLVDAAVSLQKMRLFPCGKMREPLSALKRAHTVLLTRYDQAKPEERKQLRSEILKYVPKEALFFSIHKIIGLRSVSFSKKEQNRPLQHSLPHTKEGIGAFCGIANPHSFFRSLREIGYNIQQTKIFPDHHFFSKRI